MRANIINIDGNDANCGQFSMVDGVLYNGTFKIGFDEQQLLDLSALLSWWRHGLCEQEEAEPVHSMSQARRVATQPNGESNIGDINSCMPTHPSVPEQSGDAWFKYPEWHVKDSTSAPSTDAHRHSTAGVPKIIRSATKDVTNE
jgi:hypothetical protein